MHYIDPNIVDSILARAGDDIVALIQSYGVELKKKGRNYVGKSPFREDKNPSFSVDPARGTFVDWARQEYRGNAVKFVILMESCDWLEAMHKLAERYGIDTTSQLTEAAKAHHTVKTRYYEAMAAAVAFYQKTLVESPTGQEFTQSYLSAERNIDLGDIQTWSLGLSLPGWEHLLKALTAQGFTELELKGAGLIGYSDKSQKHYDRFRGRWMIPIHDANGKAIGFGARKLPGAPDVDAKYINTSETDIYKKSEVLFGLHQAKKHMQDDDICILVEGYTDVISLHGLGVKSVVASCGTALTSQQARTIKRYATRVIIIRDGDEAGIKATARDIEVLLNEGILATVLQLPTGKDPDTFIQEVHSHGFLQYLEAEQKDWLEWSISILSQTFDLTQPAGKAHVTDELLKLIRLIGHPVLREEYAEKTAAALKVSPESIEQLLGETEIQLPRRINWDQFRLFARRGSYVFPQNWGRAEDGGVEIPYRNISGGDKMISAGGEKRRATRVTTMGETQWGVYYPEGLLALRDEDSDVDHATNEFLYLVQDEITAEMLTAIGIPAVGLSNPEAFRSSATGSGVCKILKNLTNTYTKLVYVLPGEAWALPLSKGASDAPFKDHDAGAMQRIYATAITKLIQAFPKNRCFVLYPDHRQTEIPARESRWLELELVKEAGRFIEHSIEALYGNDNPLILFSAHEISSWTKSHVEDLMKIGSFQTFLDFHTARRLGSPFKLDRFTYKVNVTTGQAEFLAEDTPEPDVKIQRGRIWGKMRDGGWKDLTNFAMECQLRIMGKGAFGIYKIQNVSSAQTRTVIIRNNEFRKAENFAERVSEIPRLGAFSKASTSQLAELQQLVCEGAPEATNLDRVMGYYQPTDEIDNTDTDQYFWVFGNGILNGSWKPCDQQGLVNVDGETFYLPAYSNIKEDPAKHEKRYERQIGFTFEQGPLGFPDWQKHIYEVYGWNGIALIAFATMAMYYDLILQKQGDVPLLHLVGPPGTGKNQLIESFSKIWAKSMKWMDLQTAKITPAGYAAFFEQYSNALNIVNEYNPSSVSDDRLDPIKATYEGKLGEKKAGPNTTEMYSGKVTSAVVIMGQEEIYQKKAINHRCVVIELPEREYTQAQRTAFNTLKEMEKQGLGQIFLKLATHREMITQDFDRKFRQIQEQIDNRMNHKSGNTERLIRNWSNMLASLMILIDNGVVDFLMSPAHILDYAAEQIQYHDSKMTQQGLMQIFFEDFAAAYYMEPKYYLHHNHVFHLEVTEYTPKGGTTRPTPQGVITVQTSNVYPLFQQFLKDRGLKIENSSKSDLRREMKSHPAFIAAADNEQVGFKMDENRRVKFKLVNELSEPIPHRTSAYVFDAQRLEIDLRRAWSFQDVGDQPTGQEEPLPF